MKHEEHSLFFATVATPGKIVFSAEELHHIRSVLRLDAGSVVRATDGRGCIYTCNMRSVDKHSGEADVLGVERVGPMLPALEVYAGLPEREAFEEMAVHLSAMGIARIVPVACRYSQKKWWENWERHRERIDRKMVSGIKQALCPWLPELHAPVDFEDLPEAMAEGRYGKVLVADAGGAALAVAAGSISGQERICCFVGPPGGFSPDEKSWLQSLGALFAAIAPNRLRTELAAVVLCANLIQFQTRSGR